MKCDISPKIVPQREENLDGPFEPKHDIFELRYKIFCMMKYYQNLVHTRKYTPFTTHLTL